MIFPKCSFGSVTFLLKTLQRCARQRPTSLTWYKDNASQTSKCMWIMWEESDPVGPGWGLRFCIPYQLPGDADAGRLRSALQIAGSGDPSKSALPTPGSPHTTHVPTSLPSGSSQPLITLSAWKDLPPTPHLPPSLRTHPFYINSWPMTTSLSSLSALYLSYSLYVFVWLLDYIGHFCYTVGSMRSGTTVGFACHCSPST